MSKYLSCAETAKLVRQALKESFPDVKFSVRSSVYSGGSSIDISWTDGPTSKQVEKVSGCFEGSYFDGMIDYKGSIYHKLDGESVHFGANFIHTRREYSEALIQRGINAVVKGYGGCEQISVQDYRSGNAWKWKNSGGCDLCRALQLWLSGENGGADWVELDPAYPVQESKTLKRVMFAGSDEYGAPYGSGGYPQHV